MEPFDAPRPEPVMPETSLPPSDLLARVRRRLAARQPYLADPTQATTGLDNPDWEIRAAAVRALGGALPVQENVLVHLRRALQDEHPLVRATAVRVLGQCGLLDDVALAFHDADWAVREMVVIALIASGATATHPVLQEAYQDASQPVREAAALAAPGLHSQVAQSQALPQGMPLQTASPASRRAQRFVRGGWHLWQVCLAQVRLMPRGVWWGPGGLMMVTAGFAAFAAAHTPRFAPTAGVLVALVILLCAAVSVAFLADARHIPSLEIALASRTPLGVIVLSRGALVVSYLALLGVGCSGIIALSGGGSLGMLITLWAQPLLTLVAASFALTVSLGSAASLVGSLLLVGAQSCRISLAHGLSLVFSAHFWSLTPLTLVLSALFLSYAVLSASRQSRLQAVSL